MAEALIAEIQRQAREIAYLRDLLKKHNIEAKQPQNKIEPTLLTTPVTATDSKQSVFSQIGSTLSKGAQQFGPAAAQIAAQAALAAQNAPKGQRKGAALTSALTQFQ